MSRELMPKSGIMMPHVVVSRDAAVVGVSTVDGAAGAIDLTNKYLQKTAAENTYMTKTEGATKVYVSDSIAPIMEGALFKSDPFVANDVPFRAAGANGVESVDMIKVTPENTIKIGSYASSVQGVEVHTAGRLQVVDLNDGGVETKYPVYSKRYRPEIDELPFAAIGSYVKDSKGRTIGVTRTGINSDITQMTQKVTFTQPVTVADAVGDYDAVTYRQLKNQGGGSGGPTMSGISNFGIGDFHLRDSRAFIPAFEVVSDGQLLNRADYPDLWAYAQLLTPITDAAWLADAQQRGKYSTGDGSTTFRVPDRNGVQSGSLKELFARGDGGNSSNNGMAYDAALPNIVGYTAHTLLTAASNQGQVATDGAFTSTTSTSGVWPLSGGGGLYTNIQLNANNSDATYGRYGITANAIPRNFIGVWTIRAHGGFVAANTSWAVINSDTSRPSAGSKATGGSILSQYKIGSDVEAETYLKTDAYINGTYYGVIGVINKTKGVTSELTFGDDGILNSNKYRARQVSGLSWNNTGVEKGTYAIEDVNIGTNYNFNSIISAAQSSNSGYRTSTHIGQIHNDGGSFAQSCWHVSGDETNQYGVRLAIQPNYEDIYYYFWAPDVSRTYTLQKNAVSDERLKRDIYDLDASRPIEILKGLTFRSFVYKDDEKQRTRRGVIAQEAEKVEPLYVKTINFYDPDGSKKDQKQLDTTPMLLDTMAVVQDLLKRVEELEAKLAAK